MPSQFFVAAKAVVASGFTDAFNRADASTLGSPWIQPASGAGAGLGIVSNRAARPTGAVGSGFAPLSMRYALYPHGAGLQDVAVDHVLVSGGGSMAYLIFGAAVDMSSYYVVAFSGSSGTYNQFVSKFVGSTETDYATSLPITPYNGTAGATSRWRVTYDPSSGLTKVYQGGTQMLSTTISSPLAGTYVGIATDSSSDQNSLALDNFATV